MYQISGLWAHSSCSSGLYNKTFSYTDPKFEASNNSMSELRTSVGNSYKCSSKENLQITDQALVNVFNVQLQVFKIDGDKFGPGKRSAFGSPCQTQDLWSILWYKYNIL